jgi:hypothetical protein
MPTRNQATLTMESPSERPAVLKVSAFAFALVLLTSTLGSVAASARTQSGQSQSNSSPEAHNYEGVITDTHCGAKHSTSIGDTAGDCTIRCVRAGEQFALVDGESAYLLEGDPVTLKQAAGQRVKVAGTLNDGRISVTSIAAL